MTIRGSAVANSLAAVEAGARQIQGTLNGLGERCGNANLVTLIADADAEGRLCRALRDSASTTRRSASSPTSRAQLDEILNRAPNRHAPLSAPRPSRPRPASTPPRSLKDPRTYEHVEPESVGNRAQVLVSDQGGQSNSSPS